MLFLKAVIIIGFKVWGVAFNFSGLKYEVDF